MSCRRTRRRSAPSLLLLLLCAAIGADGYLGGASLRAAAPRTCSRASAVALKLNKQQELARMLELARKQREIVESGHFCAIRHRH